MSEWLELKYKLAQREWLNADRVIQISLGTDGEWRAWIDDSQGGWPLTMETVRRLGLVTDGAD